MLQAFAVSPAAADAFSVPPAPASHSPKFVREEVAALVAKNQLPQATALVTQALITHPGSQDLLSIMALVCEAKQDWGQAAHFLERLIKVQGQGVSAESLRHYVRVLRCQGRLTRALKLAQRGLHLYPKDQMLESEVLTLDSLLGRSTDKTGR